MIHHEWCPYPIILSIPFSLSIYLAWWSSIPLSPSLSFDGGETNHMETSRLEQLFSQPLSLTLKLIHQKLCMDTFRISAWNENTSITFVSCSSVSKYWEHFDFTSLFKTRRFRHSFPSLMVVLFKSYFTSGGEISRSFPKKGERENGMKRKGPFWRAT